MRRSPTVHRRRWQIKLSTFLIVPVVCAFAFYAVSELTRFMRQQSWKDDTEWLYRPRSTRFFPAEGAWVRAGDPLLKVAKVNDRKVGSIREYFRRSVLLMPDGMIKDQWAYVGEDAGGDVLGSASAEGLAQLPTYLKRLPPSDPTSTMFNCIIIAFRKDGAWVVRKYRLDAIPKEVHEISKELHVYSHTDKKIIESW